MTWLSGSGKDANRVINLDTVRELWWEKRGDETWMTVRYDGEPNNPVTIQVRTPLSECIILDADLFSNEASGN